MAVSNDWINAKNVGNFVKNVDNGLKVVKKTATFLKPIYKGGKFTPLGIGIGLGTLAVEAAYIGYDNYTKDRDVRSFYGITDGAIATSKPKAVTAKVPSIEKPMSDTLETINANTKSYNDAMAKMDKSVANNNEVIRSINDTLGQKFSGMPLLQNQIYLKDSIDTVSQHLGEMVGAMASQIQLYDSHMVLLNATLLTIAKNTQVNTQIQKNISEDYGSADFFYAFTPTPEYWHNVDEAEYQYQTSLLGHPPSIWVAPSSIHAPHEIELVDSLQGTATKSEIRKAIEAFRTSKVSSQVRALLGVSLVKTQADSLEAQKAQTEYFKVATPAIQARAETQEAIKASTQALAEAQTVSAEHLGALVDSVAPDIAKIAQTAVSAKVVYDHAQTVREIRDLDGDVVAIASPMVLEASKNVALARGETDTNKIGGDLLPTAEELFGLDIMDKLKIFSYFPITASTDNLSEDMQEEYQVLLDAWKGAQNA